MLAHLERLADCFYVLRLWDGDKPWGSPLAGVAVVVGEPPTACIKALVMHGDCRLQHAHRYEIEKLLKQEGYHGRVIWERSRLVEGKWERVPVSVRLI